MFPKLKLNKYSIVLMQKAHYKSFEYNFYPDTTGQVVYDV